MSDDKVLNISVNMTNLSPCLARMSRLSLSSGRQSAYSLPARFLAPKIQVRCVTKAKEKKPSGNPQKNKTKGVVEKKKKKGRTTYLQYDMKDSEQFSLCDAMRYAVTVSPTLHNI